VAEALIYGFGLIFSASVMQLPAPAPVSNQESIEHLFRDACPVYLIASSIPDGCRWLQVVAGGCRWLQVVAGGCRWFAYS